MRLRRVGRQLDGAAELRDGELGVARLASGEIGVPAVEVSGSEVRVEVQGLLYVVECPVDVAGPASRNVGARPVHVRARVVGIDRQRVVQAGQGAVRVAAGAALQVGDGEVEAAGRAVGAERGRPHKVVDRQIGVSRPGSGQVGERTAVECLDGVGPDGEDLREQPHRLVVVGQVAFHVGASQQEPQIGQRRGLRRRRVHRAQQHRLGPVGIVLLQVELAEGQQRDVTHLAGQADVDRRRQLRRGGSDVDDLLVAQGWAAARDGEPRDDAAAVVLAPDHERRVGAPACVLGRRLTVDLTGPLDRPHGRQAGLAYLGVYGRPEPADYVEPLAARGVVDEWRQHDQRLVPHGGGIYRVVARPQRDDGRDGRYHQ